MINIQNNTEMKQKVKFSLFSIILTAVILIIFVVGVFTLTGNEEKLTLFCIIMGMTTIAGLYFCPKSIEANELGITLHRLWSSPKVFLYSTIQSVDTILSLYGRNKIVRKWRIFRLLGIFQRHYNRLIFRILWQ